MGACKPKQNGKTLLGVARLMGGVLNRSWVKSRVMACFGNGKRLLLNILD